MLLLLALACATTPEAPAPPEPAAPSASTPAAPEPAAQQVPRETPDAAAVPLLPGDKDAGLAARCADGQVVMPFWQGEYPGPVVQVGEGVSARVAMDPCGKATRDCALAAGLYHPWAAEGAGPEKVGFQTRLRTSRYTAKQATTLAGQPFAVGDELEVLSYLSEGMCSMRRSGVVFQETCPGVSEGDDAVWAEVGGPTSEPTQLLEVRCAGETRPFWLTVDAAFMATEGVQEGVVTGYGEIGPAGSGPAL